MAEKRVNWQSMSPNDWIRNWNKIPPGDQVEIIRYIRGNFGGQGVRDFEFALNEQQKRETANANKPPSDSDQAVQWAAGTGGSAVGVGLGDWAVRGNESVIGGWLSNSGQQAVNQGTTQGVSTGGSQAVTQGGSQLASTGGSQALTQGGTQAISQGGIEAGASYGSQLGTTSTTAGSSAPSTPVITGATRVGESSQTGNAGALGGWWNLATSGAAGAGAAAGIAGGSILLSKGLEDLIAQRKTNDPYDAAARAQLAWTTGGWSEVARPVLKMTNSSKGVHQMRRDAVRARWEEAGLYDQPGTYMINGVDVGIDGKAKREDGRSMFDIDVKRAREDKNYADLVAALAPIGYISAGFDDKTGAHATGMLVRAYENGGDVKALYDKQGGRDAVYQTVVQAYIEGGITAEKRDSMLASIDRVYGIQNPTDARQDWAALTANRTESQKETAEKTEQRAEKNRKEDAEGLGAFDPTKLGMAPAQPQAPVATADQTAPEAAPQQPQQAATLPPRFPAPQGQAPQQQQPAGQEPTAQQQTQMNQAKKGGRPLTVREEIESAMANQAKQAAMRQDQSASRPAFAATTNAPMVDLQQKMGGGQTIEQVQANLAAMAQRGGGQPATGTPQQAAQQAAMQQFQPGQRIYLQPQKQQQKGLVGLGKRAA